MGMAVECDSTKLEQYDSFFEPDATLPTPDSECCKKYQRRTWLLLCVSQGSKVLSSSYCASQKKLEMLVRWKLLKLSLE